MPSTKMSTKTQERTTRINQGIETRLALYTERIELERRRFLRNMIHTQVFLRREYKRLKDEKFRNMSEHNAIRHHDIGKAYGFEEIKTDGILHCPGVQDRSNRQKNLKKSMVTNDLSATTSEKLSGEKERQSDLNQNFHPIPIPSVPIGNNVFCQKSFQFQTNTKHTNHTLIDEKTKNPKTSIRASSSSVQNHSSKASREKSSGNIASRNRTSTSCSDVNSDNLEDRSSRQNERDSFKSRKGKRNRSLEKGRRHTAPMLSRLSAMKKQIMEEEAEYVLRLRKKNQELENENVTRKVWAFIGKRPVSAFAAYSVNGSLGDDGNKRRETEPDINEDENQELLHRIQRLSRRV